MTEVRTVKYDPPLKDGSRDVPVVHVRRMTLKDQLGVEKIGGTIGERETRMVSLLTGLSIETLEGMDEFEFRPLQETVKNFPPRRRVTFDAPSSSSPASPDGGEQK